MPLKATINIPPKRRLMLTIEQLREQYLQLTNIILPSIAKSRGFPVTHNHCQMRVVLDNLFQGCWYDYLKVGKTPAYLQLNATQLQSAINIAQSLIDRDNAHFIKLHQQSLTWRRARRNT